MDLSGIWECGTAQVYDGTICVPGLAGDAGSMAAEPFWLRRKITLPAGKWRHAVLTLKGARFAPSVHVNGRLVSQAEGGMSATIHRLDHPDVCPGATLTLEIALHPLSALAPTDASRIPRADHWRADVASHLWDAPLLSVHGAFRIARVVPFTDFRGPRVTSRHSSLELTRGVFTARVSPR